MTLTSIFAAVLRMSAVAAIAALVILALNALLKRVKAPAFIRGALWLVVLFRLLIPVSFSADYSLFAVLPTSVADARPSSTSPGLTQQEGLAAPVAANPAIPLAELPREQAELAVEESDPPIVEPAAAPFPPALPWLWVAVAAALLLHGLVSYWRLQRRLATATRLRANIYESGQAAAPFVCGFMRPRIYLPPTLSATESSYIIRHEQIHIRRGDHLQKALWYGACCLHWFNPAAWLSFYLLSRDMELSCDEVVLRELGPAIKADYSGSLLALASRGRLLSGGTLAGSPLAFGETGVKERVRRVLAYKKPVIWVSAVAAVAVIVCAVVLLANPVTPVDAEAETARLRATTKIASFSLPAEDELTSTAYLTYLSHAELLDELSGLLPQGRRVRPALFAPASQNDTPPVADYLHVRMMADGQGEDYFVYERQGRYFIYRPYVSVNEIDKAIYDELAAIYAEALALRRRKADQDFSIPDYSAPYQLTRYGDYFSRARHYLHAEAETALAERITASYRLTSAAWPALSWNDFYENMLYVLTKAHADVNTEIHETYNIYEYDGNIYIQQSYDGQRALMDTELLAQLAALFTAEDVKSSQAQARDQAMVWVSAVMMLRQAVLDMGWEEPLPAHEWYAQHLKRVWPSGKYIVLGEEAIVFDAASEPDAPYHEGVICLFPRYSNSSGPDEEGFYRSNGMACCASFTISAAGELTVGETWLKGIGIGYHRPTPDDGLEEYFIREVSYGSSNNWWNYCGDTYPLPQNETVLAGLSAQMTELLQNGTKEALLAYIEQLLKQYATEQGLI